MTQSTKDLKPPIISRFYFSVCYMAVYDELNESERKPSKRGFGKIDVVDVILSEEPSTKANLFEQLTESALRHKGTNQGLTYEPSYRQNPKKKFDPDLVTRLLQEHLEKELRELSYTEKESINAVKRIAYYIRKAIKQLYYDRYRIVVQVRIIEKLNQGLETRMGFLWDSNCDAFASYAMETHSFAAYAVVYGVYKE